VLVSGVAHASFCDQVAAQFSRPSALLRLRVIARRSVQVLKVKRVTVEADQSRPPTLGDRSGPTKATM